MNSLLNCVTEQVCLNSETTEDDDEEERGGGNLCSLSKEWDKKCETERVNNWEMKRKNKNKKIEKKGYFSSRHHNSLSTIIKIKSKHNPKGPEDKQMHNETENVINKLVWVSEHYWHPTVRRTP